MVPRSCGMTSAQIRIDFPTFCPFLDSLSQSLVRKLTRDTAGSNFPSPTYLQHRSRRSCLGMVLPTPRHHLGRTRPSSVFVSEKRIPTTSIVSDSSRIVVIGLYCSFRDHNVYLSFFIRLGRARKRAASSLRNGM